MSENCRHVEVGVGAFAQKRCDVAQHHGSQIKRMNHRNTVVVKSQHVLHNKSLPVSSQDGTSDPSIFKRNEQAPQGEGGRLSGSRLGSVLNPTRRNLRSSAPQFEIIIFQAQAPRRKEFAPP